MSSYTMQLKAYIEMWTQFDATKKNTRDKIEVGRTKLFDFEYPIFDENYRKVFETHFIRNFYTREIGFETEGLFKFHLETWLNIHMPYFNKLFESELLVYDPLKNSEMDMTWNKTNDKDRNDTKNTTANETNVASSTDSRFNRNVSADTPDTRLALDTQDGVGVLEYASQIDENKNSGSSDGNSTTDNNIDETLTSGINEVEDFIQHRAGKIGVQTYAKMLQEHRAAFLRIEKQIFDEMQQLFMLVY
jgi:hypothetical protein